MKSLIFAITLALILIPGVMASAGTFGDTGNYDIVSMDCDVAYELSVTSTLYTPGESYRIVSSGEDYEYQLIESPPVAKHVCGAFCDHAPVNYESSIYYEELYDPFSTGD